MSGFAIRPLTAEMEAATRSLHDRLVGHPFERALSTGSFERGEYVQYLSNFYEIFVALEQRIDSGLGPCRNIWDERLARASSLEKDLSFFFASPTTPPPSLAARSYAAYLREIPQHNNHLLIAHIWTQYGKEMAGGQFLKEKVRLRASALCQNPSTGLTGALLYEFDIPSLRTWRSSWRSALDSVALTAEQRKQVVQESISAFHHTEAVLPRVGTGKL